MNRNLFKSILRNLWRNRVTSAINVLGLTMGLSSCLFLYVNFKYENTFDTHQPKADRIYRVNITTEYPSNTIKAGNTESMLAKSIKNEFPELAAVTQITGANAMVTVNPGTDNEKLFEETRASLFFADSLFLKNFDYDFIAGNPRTALDDPSSIVLTQQLVEKYYPSYLGREGDLMGKEIELFEKFRTRITGIIKTPAKNTNIPLKGLVSIEMYYKENEWDRDNWNNISQLMTFVVLQPNQDPANIESRFPAMVEKYRSKESAEMISYSLLNLKELHNASEWGMYVGNYTSSPVVMIALLAIGLFILVSACINFINLQTAQSVTRAKEVGIRKVLGGSRGQLIFQFLIETAVLTSISFLIALWITEFMLNAWNGLLAIVEMDLQLDFTVLLVGVALILIVTLISGMYPAIRLSSFQPSETLKSKSLTGGKKGGLSLRQVLVTVQFVISQILVIGTIVIAFQMNYFLNKELGFEKENILHVDSFEPDANQIKQIEQGLDAIPEINSYSISSGPPVSERYNTTFYIVGDESREAIKAGNKFVDHRYLQNYEIELIAGRNFRADEINDEIGGFIVNETLVAYFRLENNKDAIGKLINCYGVKAPIVGIIKDYHHRQLNKEIDPLIMMPFQTHMNSVDIKVNSQNVGTALPKIRSLWTEVFPNRLFKQESIDEYLEEFYIVEEIMFKSIRLFTIIAIIIGCLGLYALVSFMAIQKTKEIAVRKVLGASYIQLLNIFTRRFFVLILIAFVIAAPLAYSVMNLWLQNYPYRITIGWEVFALGLFITLMLTTITVGYISWRTAAANPAETLQYE
ncbi:MAG: FtsX-like permease family protein [Bacteroidota bacterium]